MSESQFDIFGDVQYVTESKDSMDSGLEDMDDAILKRYCEKHYAMIEKIDDIGLPEKGQQFRLVTRRVFNAMQMIEYICKREVISDLKISIYSVSHSAALILINLIDQGRIKKVEILMSNLRNKAHREKEVIIKNLFSKHPKISLFFCNSHAKTFSCATERNNYFTLEGSGNMSWNSRVENYTLDNCKELYEFSCQWMSDIKKFVKDKKEFEDCS